MQILFALKPQIYSYRYLVPVERVRTLTVKRGIAKLLRVLPSRRWLGAQAIRRRVIDLLREALLRRASRS